MRSAMNPIRSRMQMRMPNPGGMPAVIPPDMGDDEMEFPGGGDMGMEMSAPYEDNLPPNPLLQPPAMGPAQAMPVHDMGQAQQFYKGMGKSMPAPVQGMTNTMQQTPEGPLRSKLHAAQHQMMAGDQKSAISMKRMELSSKKQQLESLIQSIRRGEVMDQDGRMFNKIAAGISQIDGLLQQFPVEGPPGR